MVAEARDKATGAAIGALGIHRVTAAGIVDRIVAAAAVDATMRVAEELIENLSIAGDRAHETLGTLLEARR